MAGMLSGLDIHYDLGEGHPLLGRRMPDLDLGSRTVFDLLHDARPVLLNLGEPGALTAYGVLTVDAAYDGPWELPVLGEVAAPDGRPRPARRPRRVGRRRGPTTAWPTRSPPGSGRRRR